MIVATIRTSPANYARCILHLRTCVDTCIHVCLHTHVCKHMYASLHTHISRSCLPIHMQKTVPTHTITHTHTRACILQQDPPNKNSL